MSLINVTLNRILENGTKTEIDLFMNHVVCLSNYYRPGIDKDTLEKLQATTCVVMLSNGVVMHVEAPREKLRNMKVIT